MSKNRLSFTESVRVYFDEEFGLEATVCASIYLNRFLAFPLTIVHYLINTTAWFSLRAALSGGMGLLFYDMGTLKASSIYDNRDLLMTLEAAVRRLPVGLTADGRLK